MNAIMGRTCSIIATKLEFQYRPIQGDTNCLLASNSQRALVFNLIGNALVVKKYNAGNFSKYGQQELLCIMIVSKVYVLRCGRLVLTYLVQLFAA